MHALPLDLHVALLGNPNCGKTALFNLLTGSRQKVANYAGVTVERKEGLLRTASGRRVRELGLPIVVALNMSDVARRRGIHIDRAVLERELGVPVVETVGVRHEGARALATYLESHTPIPQPSRGPWTPPSMQDVLDTQQHVRR